MTLRPPTGNPEALLARRDPTIKLALVLIVSAVMLFVVDPITPTLLYLLALIGVFAGTRAPVRTVALAHLPFVAFALGLFVVNALSRPGRILWHLGPVQVSAEGMTVGAALAMRTLLIGALAIMFLASTDPVALVTSLHQNARLSTRVTYALLAGYRMLQDMPREWETIRHAHAVRAPARSRHRLPRSPRQLAQAIFTLLVVSVRRGERIAQSLELRGLGLAPRTVWRPTPIRRADWLMVATVLATLAAVLTLGAAAGFLAGLGAFTG